VTDFVKSWSDPSIMTSEVTFLIKNVRLGGATPVKGVDLAKSRVQK